MSLIQDKVAVVTGASSGVGKALALRLAAEGAGVCLIARNGAKLQKVLDSAPCEKNRLRAYMADLTVDAEVRQVTRRLEHDFGHVDILVHSAGMISLGRLESAPIEDLDSHYRCNVRVPYLLTQALLPRVRVCRGQIVFINSSAGTSARANVGQYAASKHALKALADSLREEVNPYGVRVLSVHLGRTATPMQQKVHQLEGRVYRDERLIQPDEVAALLVGLLSIQRSAEITEITLRPMLKPL